MPRKDTKKDTIEFLNVLVSNSNKASNYAFGYNVRNICLYLESLSSLSRKSIFSDCYWNKYPKYVSWKDHKPENVKSHGHGLKKLLGYLASNKHRYPNTYKSVVLNSKGIILNFAIESFSGKDKMSLAKRGLTSVDSRVRKVSARILPIKMIEPLIGDSDWGVRAIVATRISPSAKPDLFLNSKNSFARVDAISASDFSKDTIFKMIAERSSSNSRDWMKAKEIICLLDKLDDTDLLYFVNLSDTNSAISHYFNERLS